MLEKTWCKTIFLDSICVPTRNIRLPRGWNRKKTRSKLLLRSSRYIRKFGETSIKSSGKEANTRDTVVNHCFNLFSPWILWLHCMDENDLFLFIYCLCWKNYGHMCNCTSFNESALLKNQGVLPPRLGEVCYSTRVQCINCTPAEHSGMEVREKEEKRVFSFHVRVLWKHHSAPVHLALSRAQISLFLRPESEYFNSKSQTGNERSSFTLCQVRCQWSSWEENKRRETERAGRGKIPI